jgi:hypothetical protein
MSTRTPEQDALHGLFHTAWGQATESPSYDKTVWRKLDTIIGEFTRPYVASSPTSAPRDEEFWRGFPIGHWFTLLGAIRNGKELPVESVTALEKWRTSKSGGA